MSEAFKNERPSKKSVALSGVAAGNTALCTVGRTGNDLHYRGYDILDFADKAEFEEIAYLLVHEKLPTAAELVAYKKKLKSLRGLPGPLKTALECVPKTAHPMDVLRTGCSVHLGMVGAHRRAAHRRQDHPPERPLHRARRPDLDCHRREGLANVSSAIANVRPEPDKVLRRLEMRWFVGFLLTFLAAGGAGAQQPPKDAYPSRAVTIIVPVAPGGTVDAVPRIVAERLRERWRQPVIIENRPGNTGNIGAATVARAEPNGYTLLASPAGTLVMNQFVQKNVPFDPEKLVPVVLLSKLPIALSVRTGLPVNSASELIAYAKQNPGKLNYATQGPGSTPHLTTVMFQTMTGVDLVHVPYKGSAPALADLIAGTVDMMFDTYTSSLSHHKAGKLKLLAIASARRLPNLPNVPTLREAGLEEFESSTWNGLLAPPGTPEAIVNAINRAVNEALASPETRPKLVVLGIDPAGGTPEDFSNFMKQERQRWQKVVRAANIPLE